MANFAIAKGKLGFPSGSSFATFSMLNWFVDEQVEEMDSMNSILMQIKRMGEDGNGIFMLDKELAQRTFSPPVVE